MSEYYSVLEYCPDLPKAHTCDLRRQPHFIFRPRQLLFKDCSHFVSCSRQNVFGLRAEEVNKTRFAMLVLLDVAEVSSFCLRLGISSKWLNWALRKTRDADFYMENQAEYYAAMRGLRSKIRPFPATVRYRDGQLVPLFIFCGLNSHQFCTTIPLEISGCWDWTYWFRLIGNSLLKFELWPSTLTGY